MTSFTKVTLNTPRLRLRVLDQDDTQALMAIYTDAETLRYFSCTPWQRPEQATEHIAQTLRDAEAGNALRLALALDGRLIGSCTLYAIDRRNQRCEMGYILSRAHWGRGYMAEALTALLDYAFGPLALHRIEADIHPDNIASERILQRLHFRKEGHLRERWFVGDEVSDSIIYGLLRKDWEAAIHPAQ